MELFAAKSKAYFAAAGGEVSLDVTTTNVDEWDVESTAAWVTAVKDGDKVKITAAPFGTTRREATVNLVTPVDASMVYPITVVQRADPSGPTADILDVVFDENGSARDISAAGNTVKYVAGSACKMGWNDVYMKYAPSFSHKQAGSGITSGFYRVEYTDAMMSALDDGYTMEALIKPAKAPTVGDQGVLGDHFGRYGIMIGSTARGKGLEFIQHNGSAWCFASSGVVPRRTCTITW